jgi:hypothetical protein
MVFAPWAYGTDSVRAWLRVTCDPRSTAVIAILIAWFGESSDQCDKIIGGVRVSPGFSSDDAPETADIGSFAPMPVEPVEVLASAKRTSRAALQKPDRDGSFSLALPEQPKTTLARLE